MKISKLNYEKLSEKEKYCMVMSNIVDLAQIEPSDDTKADLIIVLGASPIPIRARILKMMELVKKGYANKVLLSGGMGWEKLYKKVQIDPNTKKPIIDDKTGKPRIVIDENKKQELLRAIENTISADLLGNNPTEKEQRLYERFIKGMSQLKHDDHVKPFEENQQEKSLGMTEEEFMQLIMLTNGGLPEAKIFHEPFSTTTKENMEYTKRTIESLEKNGEINKVKKVIIVTSSFHCTRAMLTFKKNFPNIEVLVCPSTRDLEDRKIAIGEQLLEHPYYKKQINNESQCIINYSKNGSIADVELDELVDNDIVQKIVAEQSAHHEIME